MTQSSSETAAPAATVTHVLCCPRCSFMSLQSEALASHVLQCHALSQVPLFRCRLCLAASTQSDIMMEHIAAYHGAGSVGKDQLMLKEVIRSPEATPTGSRKRKSNIPERIASDEQVKEERSESVFKRVQLQQQQPQQQALEPSTPTKSILLPLGLPCGVLGVISNNFTFGFQTETPLDLSLKTKAQQSAASREQLRATETPLIELPAPCMQQQQQQQRQNFSCSQNDQLLRWFGEHRDRPYPGAEDTKYLAQATGLTYSQVKKWFANKRMRSKPATSASPSSQDESAISDNELPMSNRSLTASELIGQPHELPQLHAAVHNGPASVSTSNL